MLKTEDNYRNYLYVIEGAIYHTEVAQPQVNLDITIAQSGAGSLAALEQVTSSIVGGEAHSSIRDRVYDRRQEAEQKHVEIMEDRRDKLVASSDKEVNQAARDSDDALVCCIKNTIKDRIMDYGASFCATYCKEELERFKLRSGKVCLADGKTLDIAGVGDVVPKTSFGTNYTLKDVRIVMLKMVPETPIQFGVAERLSRTFRAESTRLRAEAPKMLWADSVSTAYLIYRIPYIPIGLRIPKEEWRGKDIGLAHLKAAAQMKCDTAFEIRRVTRLFEAEISHLWTQIYGAKSLTDSSILTKPIQKSQEVLVYIPENLAENGSIVAKHGLSSKNHSEPRWELRYD
ncbi:hypothetical protein Tco_1206810 [Tanacetum coccineum]